MDKIKPVTGTAGRWTAIALMVAGLIPLAGCRICADCEGMSYPAYGGSWQRTRRDAGRVGSIFDPGGVKTSELVARDAPADPDELERMRQESFGSGAYNPQSDPDQDSDSKPDDEGELEKNDLRDRSLDDFDEEMDDDLRGKGVDDIDVRIIPGQPMPPVLR